MISRFMSFLFLIDVGIKKSNELPLYFHEIKCIFVEILDIKWHSYPRYPESTHSHSTGLAIWAFQTLQPKLAEDCHSILQTRDRIMVFKKRLHGASNRSLVAKVEHKDATKCVKDGLQSVLFSEYLKHCSESVPVSSALKRIMTSASYHHHVSVLSKSHWDTWVMKDAI